MYQANMKSNMHRLAELLADGRKRKRMTLRGVEESIGISNAYLSQLETAKIQSPSPVVLHKLSELYGLSYAVVMRTAGYPLPKDTRSSGPEARLAARMGNVTAEEEDALVDYLRFIRSRRNQGGA
jgi:transcriptional regulator with XRE-family HTH domain